MPIRFFPKAPYPVDDERHPPDLRQYDFIDIAHCKSRRLNGASSLLLYQRTAAQFFDSRPGNFHYDVSDRCIGGYERYVDFRFCHLKKVHALLFQRDFFKPLECKRYFVTSIPDSFLNSPDPCDNIPVIILTSHMRITVSHFTSIQRSLQAP